MDFDKLFSEFHDEQLKDYDSAVERARMFYEHETEGKFVDGLLVYKKQIGSPKDPLKLEQSDVAFNKKNKLRGEKRKALQNLKKAVQGLEIMSAYVKGKHSYWHHEMIRDDLFIDLNETYVAVQRQHEARADQSVSQLRYNDLINAIDIELKKLDGKKGAPPHTGLDKVAKIFVCHKQLNDQKISIHSNPPKGSEPSGDSVPANFHDGLYWSDSVCELYEFIREVKYQNNADAKRVDSRDIVPHKSAYNLLKKATETAD